MIADHDKADTAMRAAFKDVKEGLSLGGMKLMHDMFAAMANVYTLELVICTPEQLGAKQAAVKQMLQLQKAMLPNGELPKI
ncbi:hypothetical protein D3C87_1302730 [compost metagenome]